MSKKGGRGGSMAQLASALGIQRGDIGTLVNRKREEPKLYTPLARSGAEIEMSNDLQFMVDMKQAVIRNFEASEFYRNESLVSDMDKSYSDKYLEQEKDIFLPYLNRVPIELHPKKTKEELVAARKRKYEIELKSRIADLEAMETQENGFEKKRKPSGYEDEEEEQKDDDENVYSDDDYLEEDNDYATTYFDNGEAYEAGSDDNLGDDY
uniref:DNA-directed RNA polymerase III subunit n=1 Tax=Strongyloides venezuelensis TaxID=75913 RepID=A0A0K0FVZ6_STRVS